MSVNYRDVSASYLCTFGASSAFNVLESVRESFSSILTRLFLNLVVSVIFLSCNAYKMIKQNGAP